MLKGNSLFLSQIQKKPRRRSYQRRAAPWESKATAKKGKFLAGVHAGTRLTAGVIWFARIVLGLQVWLAVIVPGSRSFARRLQE
jgi:hypothetical protein